MNHFHSSRVEIDDKEKFVKDNAPRCNMKLYRYVKQLFLLTMYNEDYSQDTIQPHVIYLSPLIISYQVIYIIYGSSTCSVSTIEASL